MDKTILVTGSSRGIGKAIALYLASVGYDIVIHCRSRRAEAEAVAEAVRGFSQQARVLQFDVSDRDSTELAITSDIEQYGAYYGVVCNAGIVSDAAFPAMMANEWDSVIQTNLNSFYNVLHPLVMPMVRRRAAGRIVTLASVSGLIGNRGQTNYAAAKGGVIAATKSLAIELAKRKITVNCVAPGYIDTDMVEDAPIKEILEMIPVKRAGTTKEVASAVAYLMSDDAAYITRQVISVNGGIC